jgi:hypothetical protein
MDTQASSLPDHSRNYFYRRSWKDYQTDKLKLPDKTRIKFAELLVSLRETGKIHDVRPWAKTEYPRVYFSDKSFISLHHLMNDWTHSGEGTMAQDALLLIGWPRNTLDKSVYTSINRD